MAPYSWVNFHRLFNVPGSTAQLFQLLYSKVKVLYSKVQSEWENDWKLQNKVYNNYAQTLTNDLVFNINIYQR